MSDALPPPLYGPVQSTRPQSHQGNDMSNEQEDEELIDTDTKLAILASLLEPATFPLDELLEALQASNGEIGPAAEALLLPRVKKAGKRKAGSSLESWLGKKRAAIPAKAEALPAKATATATATGARDDNAKSGIETGSSANSSTSTKAKSASLMDILKQPTTPEKTKNVPRPAVILHNQKAIDHHSLPLTLLQSPLSPAFASALYLTMMEESETWERNKFYIAGKWVESPHTVCHYSKDPPPASDTGAGKEIELLEGKEGKKATYMWSGQEIKPGRLYPALLRKAAEMIEPVVDAAIRGRPRYPYEWAADWQASVCGANRYDGASSNVGWHADQLTYLGPYTTIASLSLGTPRAFRLRQTDPVDPLLKNPSPTRTYEVNLAHNSLVLMNAGCQERYKHTVPIAKALDLFRPNYDIEQRPILPEDQKAHTSRINITFRFYRPDFHPIPSAGLADFALSKITRQGTPYCKCGIPTLLRADQKAKARSYMGTTSPRKGGLAKSEPKVEPRRFGGQPVVDDDMVFFWQCQSPGQTGDMKGCGFFRILDMKAEGRGPCIVDTL